METKKNPSKDVHRKSFRFFLIGLSVSVSLIIVAFEWKTKIAIQIDKPQDRMPDGYIYIMPSLVQVSQQDSKPAEKIRKPLSIVTVIEQNEIEISAPQVQMQSGNENDFPIIDIAPIDPEIDTTSITSFPEVQPHPVGGYDQFYSTLSKNLKYPRQAVRQNIDGKVFVEFVVNRQGLVSDLKVIKGIGSGCDEEALRVLSLTTWEAGRQRGRPVNVRMVIPVFFKIQ